MNRSNANGTALMGALLVALGHVKTYSVTSIAARSCRMAEPSLDPSGNLGLKTRLCLRPLPGGTVTQAQLEGCRRAEQQSRSGLEFSSLQRTNQETGRGILEGVGQAPKEVFLEFLPGERAHGGNSPAKTRGEMLKETLSDGESLRVELGTIDRLRRRANRFQIHFASEVLVSRADSSS